MFKAENDEMLALGQSLISLRLSVATWWLSILGNLWKMRTFGHADRSGKASKHLQSQFITTINPVVIFIVIS